MSALGGHTPTRIPPGPSKLADVHAAILNARGNGATPAEIRTATGHPERQTAPILWALTAMRAIRPVATRGPRPPGGWPATVYVAAHIAPHLGPAAHTATATRGRVSLAPTHRPP